MVIFNLGHTVNLIIAIKVVTRGFLLSVGILCAECYISHLHFVYACLSDLLLSSLTKKKKEYIMNIYNFIHLIITISFSSMELFPDKKVSKHQPPWSFPSWHISCKNTILVLLTITTKPLSFLVFHGKAFCKNLLLTAVVQLIWLLPRVSRMTQWITIFYDWNRPLWKIYLLFEACKELHQPRAFVICLKIFQLVISQSWIIILLTNC